MRRSKLSMLFIAVTVITAATLFLLPYTPKIAVSTAKVILGDLVLTTFLDGTVVYENEQPCAAIQPGVVKSVCVEKGQRVSAGELLFSLDSSYEQQAIETISGIIYEQERTLSSLPYSEAAAAACAQSLTGLRTQLAELRTMIEAKQVRAQSDGVVGGVFVQCGDKVLQGSILGLIHSDSKQLNAVCRAADTDGICLGTPANLYGSSGKPLGLAYLSLTGAPSANEITGQLMQVLCLTPIDDSVLAETEIGDSVAVELLLDVLPDKALAPVSAVDSSNMIWLAKDGRAFPVKIDIGRRNETQICVPEQYIGCDVVLLPGNHSLYSGCPIKEHKKSEAL